MRLKWNLHIFVENGHRLDVALRVRERQYIFGRLNGWAFRIGSKKKSRCIDRRILISPTCSIDPT